LILELVDRKSDQIVWRESRPKPWLPDETGPDQPHGEGAGQRYPPKLSRKGRDSAAVVAAAVLAGTLVAQQVAAKAARDALFLAAFRVTSLPAMMLTSAALGAFRHRLRPHDARPPARAEPQARPRRLRRSRPGRGA
jgi:hypothetical protein